MSPRPGPRRPIIGVRMDPTAIDRLAKREHRTRSEMIRLLVEEALAARKAVDTRPRGVVGVGVVAAHYQVPTARKAKR